MDVYLTRLQEVRPLGGINLYLRIDRLALPERVSDLVEGLLVRRIQQRSPEKQE